MTDADATLSSSTQFWQSGHVYVPELGTLVNTQRIFTPDEVGGIGAQSSKYSERAIDVAAGLRGTMFDNRFDWDATRSEEHTSELQSLMRISYAVFCMKKKIDLNNH